MVQTNSLMQDINRLVEALQQEIKVSYVVLYGSQNSGVADENSDIDIAIVSPDFGCRPLDDSKLVYKKVFALDISPNLDIKTYSPEEFENEDNFFIQEIKRTGQIIYPVIS